MDLAVQGKTYLVMGGSRGLGRAVADALSAEGARVIHTSRKPGQDTVLDTGDAESRRAFLSSVRDDRFDGIFVNTGGPRTGDFVELEDADWEKAFHQILLGPIHVVRHLLPQVNSGGSLLFNTSSSIQTPIPHLMLSNVFRAGIHALVKTLADELSPRGIRVNLIVPGRIATERVEELDQSNAERLNLPVETVRSRAESHIPMGRYGTPEEFGRLAAFVMSPQASYLNGASFWVDGGQNRSL